MYKLLFTISFLFSIACIQAQPVLSGMHRDQGFLYEQFIQKSDTGYQLPGDIRPFVLPVQKINTLSDDSLLLLPPVLFLQDTGLDRHFSGGYTQGRDMMSWKYPGISFSVNPLMDFQGYVINEGNHIYRFNRNIGLAAIGAEANAVAGKNLTFQLRFLRYYGSPFLNTVVGIPGPGYDINPDALFYYSFYPGRSRDINQSIFLKNHHSSYLEGHISWQAIPQLHFLLGNGKNFIGSGYRSLILSDNAGNYPYLRIQTRLGKITYTNLYASMNHIRVNATALLWEDIFYTDKKFSAMQMLGFPLGKRLYLTLFNGVVWNSTQINGKRSWDPNFLNPVIFYHPVNFSMNSAGNVLMGLQSRWKLKHNHVLYSQWIIDDLNMDGAFNGKGYFQSKVGGQLGVLWMNLFKVSNLTLRIESNAVRPYVYGNRQPELSHSHEGQALAHHAGANFFECLGILHYRRNTWIMELKTVYRKQGLDYFRQHAGSNILLGENWVDPLSFGNQFLQGKPNTILMNNIRLGKVLHAPTRLTAEINAGLGSRLDAIQYPRPYLYLALRTQLFQFYQD